MIQRIESLACEIDYKYLPDEEKIVLDRVSFLENKNFLIETRRNKSGTYRFAFGHLGSDRRLTYTNPNLISLTEFFTPLSAKQFLIDYKLSDFKSEKMRQLRRTFFDFFRILEAEIEMVNYLGPFRQIPDRYYMTGGAMPADIGFKGESSIDYLSYKKMSGEDEIIKFTKEWLRRLGYASDFDVKTIEKFIKRVSIKNQLSKIESSLVDVGFGISQVLPVIIAVCRHNYGIHVFEQPELHLHPKSQADIADLFVYNKRRKVSYIIETHSEHFLNRIRRRVAEGVLKQNEVVIYYVYQDKFGFHIQEVKIGKNGAFEDFPPNFFDESYEESKKIVEIAIEKRKKMQS